MKTTTLGALEKSKKKKTTLGTLEKSMILKFWLGRKKTTTMEFWKKKNQE
jgi:hypothetical protein